MPKRLPEPQRYAARMSAVGLSPAAIAERLNIEETTVRKWLRLPGLIELREGYAASIEQALEEDLIASVGQMLDLWRRWLAGEVPANDARIPVISPTLVRWIEGYFAIANNTPVQQGKNGPTIQILSAPGVPAPRLRAIEDDDPDSILDDLRGISAARPDRVRRQE